MRKVFVLMLVCFMFFAIEPGFADLTFGYRIQQIGNIAMLIPEDEFPDEDGSILLSNQDMLINLQTIDPVEHSFGTFYAMLSNDYAAFSHDDLVIVDADLYEVDGNNVAIVKYETSNCYFKYVIACDAIHNNVMSMIMFMCPIGSNMYPTYDDFLHAVHDYLDTIVFLET